MINTNPCMDFIVTDFGSVTNLLAIDTEVWCIPCMLTERSYIFPEPQVPTVD